MRERSASILILPLYVSALLCGLMTWMDSASLMVGIYLYSSLTFREDLCKHHHQKFLIPKKIV